MSETLEQENYALRTAIEAYRNTKDGLLKRIASLQAENERLKRELDFIGPLAARMSENALKIADETESDDAT